MKTKRKDVALDQDLCKQELKKDFGCTLTRNIHSSPYDVMYWRYKIHAIAEGEVWMRKIIEILRLASTSLRKNERNQLYRINS